jgi:hypothetical protein
MNRQLCIATIIVAAAVALCRCVQAAPIAVLNAGGEEFAALTPPNVQIVPGGAGDIAVTGWNSTLLSLVGEEGVEGIGNNARSGEVRLAFGAVNSAIGDDDTNLAEDFILFQQTSHEAAEGDVYQLDFFGRAFFQFDVGTDVQTSLFGYVDSAGALVEVDTMAHPTTIPGVWTPARPHRFRVPAGSPLIGQRLTIGFFTDTPDQAQGGFTSVDDVSLSLVPEPASWILGMLAAVAGARNFHLRRRIENLKG